MARQLAETLRQQTEREKEAQKRILSALDVPTDGGQSLRLSSKEILGLTNQNPLLSPLDVETFYRAFYGLLDQGLIRVDTQAVYEGIQTGSVSFLYLKAEPKTPEVPQQ